MQLDGFQNNEVYIESWSTYPLWALDHVSIWIALVPSRQLEAGMEGEGCYFLIKGGEFSRKSCAQTQQTASLTGVRDKQVYMIG